jgi:hypothetical protein
MGTGPSRSRTPIILRQSGNYCDFSALGRVPRRGMVVYHVDPQSPPLWALILKLLRD